MTALAQELTRPAFPLGQPFDGRPRYGMTPEQARVYRWLVDNRPHGEVFKVQFREVAAGINMKLSTVHHSVRELVDRGWLYEVIGGEYTRYDTRYGLVHPVMHFKAPRHG